jgi:hypothetical protein
VTRGLAPNSQSLSRLFDAEAGCREQNDPSSFRQFLWRGMRPHQIVQFSLMLARQLHR